MRRILFSLCVLLVAGFTAVYAAREIESRVTAHIDSLLRQETARLKGVAHVSWEGVRIRPLDLGVILQRAEVRSASGHRLGIDEIFLSGRLTRKLKLKHIHVDLAGICFFDIPGYQPEGSEGFPDLYAMTVHMSAQISYDPVRQRLEIPEMVLQEKTMGSVHLSMGLDRFRPGGIMDPGRLFLRHMDLEYRDRSLFRRLVAGNSKEIIEFRQFMAEAVHLEMDGAQKSKDPDLAASLSKLKSFFENPGPLNFTLRLNRPVAFSGILNARRVSALSELITCRFTDA